jgi:hypothetical protein
VSWHQANILLSALRTPPEEEEERARGEGPEPEQVVRGAAEEEGTSMVMVGVVGFWGLRSVFSWSFMNSLPVTISIRIIICGGIPTTAESYPRNTDDLLKHEVKHWEGILLDIELDEVPLILRVSSSISNARSQGGTKETVKSVQLWKKVSDFGRSGHCT